MKRYFKNILAKQLKHIFKYYKDAPLYAQLLLELSLFIEHITNSNILQIMQSDNHEEFLKRLESVLDICENLLDSNIPIKYKKEIINFAEQFIIVCKSSVHLDIFCRQIELHYC